LNDYEFHFACYEAGTFYRRHKDVFSNDDSRKISAVLYLNKNWKSGDGGELVIYEKEEIKAEPKAGALVVFESHIEHEVLTSHTERISITGWIKRKKDSF
jgi:SM-20-related protein